MRKVFSVFLRGLCITAVIAAIGVSGASAQSARAVRRYGGFPIQGAGLKILKRALAADRAMLQAHRTHCQRSRRLLAKAAFCDADRDGLSNQLERSLGTKKRNKDTDGDGLSDRYELTKSHTHPFIKDSDGDEKSDGEEIAAGSDPLQPSATPTAADPCAANFDAQGNTKAFGIPAPNAGNISRGSSAFAEYCGTCHRSDKGTSLDFSSLKNAVGQRPMLITTLAETTLADLVAYLNRSESRQSAECAPPAANPPATPPATPEETPAVLPTPPPGTCANQYFDEAGNTAQFEIPAALVGNISRGGSLLASRCSGCHAELGRGFTYGQLKTAVTGPFMRITSLTDPQFADLTAWANRELAGTGCATPAPTATSTPGATPTPTTAPATPTPYVSSCSNQYFDLNGNTQQFGIPTPLSGNLSQGASFYSLACMSCHGELGKNFTFAQLKSAVTGPVMKIQTVTDQQYAHLTAYLNRSSAPQNCGTPTPAPTPLDDISAGRVVYDVSCRSCHSRPQEFDDATISEVREAIVDKRQMRSIVLSDAQLRQLIAYLNSL